MNTFEQILQLPGAAPVLAAKLSGRIIGRIADGFGDDPALWDMINMFVAIEHKWPPPLTMSMRQMYDLHMKDAVAEKAPSEDAMEGLTPEQKALWMKEPSRQNRADRLREVLPQIVDLHTEAEPDTTSWDRLTRINQWSLLNATERGVHNRLARYTAWAQEDEERGKTDSKNFALRDDAKEAVQELTLIITEFLTTPEVAEELEEDAMRGIRVPERMTG